MLSLRFLFKVTIIVNFWRTQKLYADFQGALVAQLVECPTSAQVIIPQSVSSSPASGSVLTAQKLEPTSILYLPLSLPLPHSRSASLSKRNKH